MKERVPNSGQDDDRSAGAYICVYSLIEKFTKNLTVK